MSLKYTSTKISDDFQLLNRFETTQFGLVHVPITLFSRDQDFVQMIFLKNKLTALYKKHIKESKLINNVVSRLKSGDYIISTKSNFNREQALSSQNQMIAEFAVWLTDYVKVSKIKLLFQ